MRNKISRMEKIAGVFVIIAIAGAVVSTIFTAVHKGWFASKVSYSTIVESADGLHGGTAVMIAGIRAGEVEEVKLLPSQKVQLDFNIFQKYQSQVRTDSEVRIVRPFLFGDKVLEISLGSEGAEILAENDQLKSTLGVDFMDLMGGKRLGPLMENLEGLMTNLSVLLEAFADPKRTESFIKVFDKVEPLVGHMNEMSKQVTILTKEMNQILPEIRKESPEVAKQTARLVSRMEKLVTALEPAVTSIGPELPRVSHRAVEALDEMVITLKAMQKSFLLRGKVDDVREEEKERSPASK